jgi:hypothetical protein
MLVEVSLSFPKVNTSKNQSTFQKFSVNACRWVTSVAEGVVSVTLIVFSIAQRVMASVA